MAVVNDVKVVLAKNVCPYRVVRSYYVVPETFIEERFDFQIKENGQIDRVSLGEFDISKEIDSHKDEVGLINCLKLATARGVDPSSFAKTEPGLMADPGDIETFDDLLTAKESADSKLKAIADQYGLTVDQLVSMVQKGEVPSPKEEPKETEGGEQ